MGILLVVRIWLLLAYEKYKINRDAAGRSGRLRPPLQSIEATQVLLETTYRMPIWVQKERALRTILLNSSRRCRCMSVNAV